MTPSFWKNRNVLLTGHTGFKGAWLCLLLERMGARVSGYALDPPTRPSLFELAGVGRRMNSVRQDVRDLDRLCDFVRQVRPDVVIHLAAQSLVRTGYNDPVTTYSTNVMGTVHVLEAARLSGQAPVVVNVTSDKCYDVRSLQRGCREDDPMGGRDPYSSSKGCAELAAGAYRDSFFAGGSPVALACARAGNVIGGGDWSVDRLVPDCIRAMLKGEPVVIRYPHAVRPWQFVLEPLGGYLLLAEKLSESPGEYAEGWNFGPDENDAWPVRRVVEHLASLWGEGASWTPDRVPQPPEAPFLRLDCTKARLRLGWRPRTDLPTALEWTVDFHRRLKDGERASDICTRQIDEFLAREERSDGR